MISDIPKKVAQMRELISVIDRPVDQVLIEGRIVIATDSFARELGAKFGITGSKDNTYFSGDLGTNSTNRTADYTAAKQTPTLCAIGKSPLLPQLRREVPPQPVPTASSITRGLNYNVPMTLSNPGSLALSILNAGRLLDIELQAMQTESRGEVIPIRASSPPTSARPISARAARWVT
jgi:type IV pilus assembly protein PilQ